MKALLFMAVFSPAFCYNKAEKAFGFRYNRVCLIKFDAFGKITTPAPPKLGGEYFVLWQISALIIGLQVKPTS